MGGGTTSFETFSGERLYTRPGMDHASRSDQQSMLRHVIDFTRRLNDAGITINPAKIIDFCRCFSYIDLANKHDFYISARSSLISAREDIPVFDHVFRTFWDRRLSIEDEQPSPPEQVSDEAENNEAQGKEQQQEQTSTNDRNDEETSDEQEFDETSYSANELLLNKDFGEMSEVDLENAGRILSELLSIIANFKGRRYAKSRQRVSLDMRSTIKNSMQYDLDLIRLAYRKQKLKKNRLILLCDVSGSMEHYSRFLIQFIAGLKQQLNNVDVAVFSTRLTDVSDLLHRKELLKTLPHIAASVHDWSGGTQIGKCLKEFNELYAKKISSSRTIVMILSDGWDRGDAKLMHDEIALLRQRIHKIIWLNPLLGRRNYQPLCRGIQTALPFIDHFLPAHNLNSLARLVRNLRTIWNH